MQTNINTNTHRQSNTANARQAKQIKLGIDVHADSYRVVRQVDNATPQPAQRFTPRAFLVWVQKQREQAEVLYTCYEAGPFGYGLHRALSALGIHNVVVRPQNWDELGRGVKTDKTDGQNIIWINASNPGSSRKTTAQGTKKATSMSKSTNRIATR